MDLGHLRGAEAPPECRGLRHASSCGSTRQTTPHPQTSRLEYESNAERRKRGSLRENRPMTIPGAHLLVVDDDEMSRDMLSRRLRRRGYTVTVAESGAKA